jgi:subtilase family serine protease
MRLRRPTAAIALVLAGVLGLATQASAEPGAGAEGGRPATGQAPVGPSAAHPAGRPAYRDVCGAARPGHARCLARVATDASARGHNRQVPGAYVPADLRDAYNLPSSTAGDGQTVAVVVAYDHPDAEADLAHYRAHFGLPPCTAASGCFRKIDQRGGGALPRPDDAWALEISLDLDMISAVCPRCRILLVEADTSSLSNLIVAVGQAAAQGAPVINNSYGVPESFAVKSFNSGYDHPGHAITAATGDSGFGVYFPGSSQYVTAVGGTSLTRASNSRGWKESAWSGGGSGCSKLFTKPRWQHDAGCARRTIVDVSAVSDPATGVAVYHTFGGFGPWLQVGGTSVASAIVAGVYALAGDGATVRRGSEPYRHPEALHDVTSGANGSCGGSYLCTAKAGYDGPSGLGTPNGTGAF